MRAVVKETSASSDCSHDDVDGECEEASTSCRLAAVVAGKKGNGDAIKPDDVEGGGEEAGLASSSDRMRRWLAAEVTPMSSSLTTSEEEAGNRRQRSQPPLTSSDLLFGWVRVRGGRGRLRIATYQVGLPLLSTSREFSQIE